MTDKLEDFTRRGLERKTFEKFLESRKNDNTREYTLAILECLSDQYDKDTKKILENEEPDGEIGGWTMKNAGWIRTKDLLKRVKIIPNESTFYQLLKNLCDKKLIQKEERKPSTRQGDKPLPGPGKYPVYYRVPGHYSSNLFNTKEEFEKELTRAYTNLSKISMRYAVAMDLLAECHKNVPGYKPGKKILEATKKRFPDYNNSR